MISKIFDRPKFKLFMSDSTSCRRTLSRSASLDFSSGWV